jgi:malate synthase
MSDPIEIRAGLREAYRDVYTPDALGAIAALAPLDASVKQVMRSRIERRIRRFRDRERIRFLDPGATIAGTSIRVQDARDGKFDGSEIPRDLQRQWLQGTGPAAKPGSTLDRSIRNVAYALLSGADGWMFDGEDALGQTHAMSLDNQRNLKLALARDPAFRKTGSRAR